MRDNKLSTLRSTSPPRIQSPVSGGERWRQVCNPLALGLLGLAFAVALWGFGYKLSLYYQSQGSADRVPVAKLWIEHRDGFAKVSDATTPRLNPRVYADSGLTLFASSSPALYLRGTPGARFLPKRPRLIPFFHSAIPLRSPPSGASL